MLYCFVVQLGTAREFKIPSRRHLAIMNSKKTITFGKISANLNKSVSEEPVETSSSGGFGTFGKKREENNVKKMDEIKPEDEEETQNMQKMMGIMSFGKKAKSFDVQEMMENITKTINSNKQSVIEKEKPREIVEPKEDKVSDNNDDDKDDDNFIGPPIPSLMLVTSEATKDSNAEKKTEKTENDDDDDDDDNDKESEEEEEVCIQNV